MICSTHWHCVLNETSARKTKHTMAKSRGRVHSAKRKHSAAARRCACSEWMRPDQNADPTIVATVTDTESTHVR